ncbi:M20/M25/M40 family metallo-hydrolase [Sphingomonas sp. LaA6.9]|uniref:M20/M25/M40 family metallo-hydrolase n=1 Tax=Sphingomonas sp. LaA6.9 TaxID=2919914 RepID=UPI001F4F23E6|nr:M20/M25/M40 family metallo-hydrolase [Sphingomonas sp. LaA6.9]MCJ8158563.1 M20/M25/M40 family metallo-hydrolase [Sphingomonas sp. LaA6.9]
MRQGRGNRPFGPISALQPLIVLALAAAHPAAAAPAATSEDQAIATIRALPAYKRAEQTLAAQHDRFVGEIITLTEIPSPPFGEAKRAAAYREMLAQHGLTDIDTDAEGNVMGLRRGTSSAGGKVIVVSAHLDTVFPAGTDVKVRREGTRLFAPGIGDDSRGLATMLAWIRALDAAKIRTRHDILFVGTVGEEGQGDLRGVRHFFTQGKYKDRVAAFYSVDGIDPAQLTHAAVGSKRYRVTFKGPGGHSFSAFGIVNPMAAAARAITDLYEIVPPTQPKTTYAAAVIGGGTSVNSIPDSVFVEFDMRSESAAELDGLERRFLTVIDRAVAAENGARSTREGSITAEKKKIGDRPAGVTPRDAAVVAYTAAAARAQGFAPEYEASSTDANVPISLGIPAITIGSGGSGERAHSTDEFIDVETKESLRGLSVGLLSVLAVAQIERR